MIIELATSFIFLVTSIYGPATTSDAILQKSIDIDNFNHPGEEVVIPRPITLEDYVREYFRDNPVLAEIARCESQNRQFGKSGKVIRGKTNPEDVGIMQINEKYQAERAEKLGFDIYTLEGNMAYAKWLYEKEGVKPWLSSSGCWSAAAQKLAANIDGRNTKRD
jgi:hypothetical protein